ncbi:hypothetical protein PINS_up010378 [Pythium insidiosum]|nr:hypothetical protein PINS_up010378 [Pythium insidiosum]
MDRLSAASDRGELVLLPQGHTAETYARVHRAHVKAGVALRVWKRSSRDLTVWETEVDDIFDVLAASGRDVFLLVPHVGICVVDRSECEFSDEEEAQWNFEHHSIRWLTLNMNMARDEEDLEDDESDGDENFEDDESDEEQREEATEARPMAAPASLPASARFLSRIGRPLEWLQLHFEWCDPLDTVFQLLPQSCPNLKRLSIDNGKLRSFKSVIGLFQQGLSLESLTLRCSALTDTRSIETFTRELRDPKSIVGQSLREITVIIHGASPATDERLLRGMHEVTQQNHHIRWMLIEIAPQVADQSPEMVESIETLCYRYHTWTPRHKLAFLSVLEAANRPVTDSETRMPCAEVLAKFDSAIASRILRFSADGDGAWGEVQLRYE